MSLKSSNKIETNVYELELTVDAATFVEAVKKAYNKQKKSIAVPGFRKGKASQGMIEKYYGDGIFFEGALDIVYPDAVEAAIKEAGLTLVDSPYDVDIPEMSRENGVVIKLKAIVAPEVTLGDYKKLSAEKPKLSVSDDDVAKEIESVQDRNSRLVAVEERAAANGDTVEMDFEGFVDGVAFEGGKGENHSLVLGSGQFIPGFEEQIVGHNTGEEFDVNVTFPTEYEPTLAGKQAIFKVKINDIKVKVLPELDDEFAKDVSEFDTLEEYKADVKKALEESKAKQAENEFENNVLDALVEVMQAEIPEVMFTKKTDDKVNEFAQRLQMQGLSMEMYMQYVGGDTQAFRATFEVQAKREVKIDLALEKIVELEAISASEEEITERVEMYATQYSMKAEEIKKAIPEDIIVKEIAIKKAVDLIKENASEKKSTAKKAEKKPAAKKATEKKAPTKKKETAE